ncbi:MAG: carbohydrate ABC transporter permease [Eubacteriales bacterium]|nr:carbohydrate ABC transporter permease [Eubacteriales bacterium]
MDAWSYIGGSFVNSIMICLISVPSMLILGSVAAYAFARLRFPCKNLLYYLILIMMMIPSMLTLISSYVLTARLGLLDTYPAVSLMNIANGLPFVVLVMRNFFAGLPEDIFEAVRLDGAREGRIYFNIALPLSKPIVVTVFVMRLLNDWNDYMWPALTLKSPQMWPVSVCIKAYKASFDLLPQYGPLYAGFAIAVLPLLVFFFLSMRYFMEGMTSGAIKG